MKRALKILAVVLVVLVAAAGAVRGYMVWDRGRDKLPVFSEPGPGPRAPRSDYLGLKIGTSTLAQAEALYSSMGVKCENSSMRALMQANRLRVQKEMAEAKARGDNPDGVTGASLANYVSKKEQNPQVRLSCQDVPTSLFTDRVRADGNAYWLIIFDSATHPLRHTSLVRSISDQAMAAAEWRATVDFFMARFGAPTTLREPDLKAAEPIAKGSHFLAQWSFSDITAEVTMFRIGGRISLQERVEVPWPVRADAPVLGAKPLPAN